MTKRTTSALTLKWTAQKEADGYLIYGNRCGKTNKLQLVSTIEKKSTNKWTAKKLKRATYYKFMVVAYKNVDDAKMPIAASVVMHAPTKGSSLTVAKSLKLSKTKVSLKVGKSIKIKAKEVKEEAKFKIKAHRPVKFESSDPSVVEVDKKGKIKAKKAGKCKIFAYAQNGVFKTVNVTVK